MTAHFSFEATIGFRKEVRDFLLRCKMKNPLITFDESKGFLVNTFFVRGPEKEIQNIYDVLDGWNKN